MSVPQRLGPDYLFTGWRAWALGFAFWTAVGLLTFTYFFLDVFVRGGTEPFYHKLIEEMTGAYGTGLLFPLVVRFARRVRRTDSKWYAKVAWHAVGGVVFSVLHTTWNAATREVVYWASGVGDYDYGILSIRYAMEFPNDVISYAIFVGFIYLFDHYRRARDRELRVAKLESELAHIRLRSLESQLHPHYLFNTLNTVSSVMYDDPGAADAMLTQLSDLLRRTLRSEGVHEVPLREELASLDLYLQIMRQRFAERMDVQVNVADDAQDAAVPQLMLQPLVENAIRYGDPGPDREARIAVSARQRDGRLQLEVRDNGPGIREPGGQLIRRGIGLQNTDRRLHHLYGDDYRLELHNGEHGGLVVSIDIAYRRVATADAK